jgi:hypothetical protein
VTNPPYGYPQAYPPPPPPRSSGTAVVVAVVAGVIGLVVVIGVIFAVFAFAGGDDKPSSASDRQSQDTSGDTSGSSSAAPSQDAQTSTSAVVGTWKGTYTCGQGLTALSLTIGEAPGGNGVLTAEFVFSPHPSNPAAESGSFSMRGSYNAGLLELFATQWINQPAGYETVDLRATVDPSGQPTKIEGTVQDSTKSCTTFSVDRA